MTPIDIPTPVEVAEANRIKDEATDDALLAEWLVRARAGIMAYRGRPVAVPLPGCDVADGPFLVLEKTTSLAYPERFAGIVGRAFHGTGWAASLRGLPRDRVSRFDPDAPTTSPAYIEFTAAEPGES